LPNEQWTQPAVGNPNVGIQAINNKVRTTSAWAEPLRQQMAGVIVGQEELIAGNFWHFSHYLTAVLFLRKLAALRRAPVAQLDRASDYGSEG